MKVEIDRTRCEGHAICLIEADEVFALGDDGKATVLQVAPAEDLREAVLEAAQACPTGAITVTP